MRMIHKKTGELYKVQLIAVEEESRTPVVVYSDEKTGCLWTRPASEFFDGRFAPFFPKRSKSREYVQ